jgi:hypothetical protein
MNITHAYIQTNTLHELTLRLIAELEGSKPLIPKQPPAEPIRSLLQRSS